ncbi:MAG: type I-E CRISPR-associated protein Cas5/CasD [Hyphomicrobiaceae bacterium]
MAEYLLFTLAAPLASFGTVAVGERRPTWDRPSKSQILGLVAGCLGIERSEEERQQALAAGIGFAVRVDVAGGLASDYHTAQAAKDVSIRRRAKVFGPIRTRADELACDDLKTILSRREFRVGSQHTIALWRATAGEPDLAAIKQALEAPVFVPFAGRKAHALMLPMAPRIIDADHIEGAFARFDATEPSDVRALKSQLRLAIDGSGPIYADVDAIPDAERTARVSRLEERRDRPESRAKWRFGLRTEALLKSRVAGGGTP